MNPDIDKDTIWAGFNPGVTKRGRNQLFTKPSTDPVPFRFGGDNHRSYFKTETIKGSGMTTEAREAIHRPLMPQGRRINLRIKK
jgi:hypothetical protein